MVLYAWRTYSADEIFYADEVCYYTNHSCVAYKVSSIQVVSCFQYIYSTSGVGIRVYKITTYIFQKN